MKFRNIGRTLLALAGTVGITLGLTACNDHTVGYVYVTGTTTNSLNNGSISQMREDNNNGSLENIQSAVGSGGSNPIRMVTAAGSRFLYVLNAGAPQMGTGALSSAVAGYSSANITIFSIGGYGQLSQQIQDNSQGTGSIRMITSGSYLYVLDQYSPVMDAQGNALPSVSTAQSASYPCQDASGDWHPLGDVTVFSIDSTTGRLQLVQNQRQQNLTYFPVGCFPVDFHIAGGFLYTMDAGSTSNNDVQTVFVQQLSSTTGQLTPTQTSVLQIRTGNTSNDPSSNPVDIEAITGDNAGGHVYLIDRIHNVVYLYTVETSGALTAVSGAEPFSNSSTQAQGPVQSLVDETGKFLYLINAGPTNNPTSNSNADITGYDLDAATGYPDTPTTLSPYTGIVSNPVCIFEDPTNQFVYVAGANDNSITGRRIDPNTGSLTTLNKGGTFPTVGTPSWCITISSTI